MDYFNLVVRTQSLSSFKIANINQIAKLGHLTPRNIVISWPLICALIEIYYETIRHHAYDTTKIRFQISMNNMYVFRFGFANSICKPGVFTSWLNLTNNYNNTQNDHNKQIGLRWHAVVHLKLTGQKSILLHSLLAGSLSCNIFSLLSCVWYQYE